MAQVCEHGTAELSTKGFHTLTEDQQAAARAWMTRNGCDPALVFEIRHQLHARYAQVHTYRKNEHGKKYVNCCGCIAQTFTNVDVIADPPPWLEEPITEGVCGWVDKPFGIPGDPRQERPKNTKK